MGFLFVALGGAAGAMGRYAISLLPVRTGFPILTLLTNIIGAVLIGFIAGIAGDNADVSPNAVLITNIIGAALIGFIAGVVSNKGDVSPNAVLFWKTGVCGGFTTFSTFSLEAFTLFENKAYLSGGLYVFLSVACCLAGIFLGKKLSMLAR